MDNQLVGREVLKINIGGGEVEGKGRGRGRNRAERAGQGICHHVFGTRDVDNFTGEFGDVG